MSGESASAPADCSDELNTAWAAIEYLGSKIFGIALLRLLPFFDLPKLSSTESSQNAFSYILL